MTKQEIALQIGNVVVAMDIDKKLPRKAKDPCIDALMELAMAVKFDGDREERQLRPD